MTDNYTIIILQNDKKGNKEIETIIDTFVKAIEAKNGKARVAYQGSMKKIIDTVDSFLDIGKLAKKTGNAV